MTSDDLEKWHAKRVREALYPKLNYLLRLRQRMEKAGFPSNDPIYVKTCKAHDSLQELYVAFNYLACDGVGRSRTRK